jgi:hypothetical protein
MITEQRRNNACDAIPRSCNPRSCSLRSYRRSGYFQQLPSRRHALVRGRDRTDGPVEAGARSSGHLHGPGTSSTAMPPISLPGLAGGGRDVLSVARPAHAPRIGLHAPAQINHMVDVPHCGPAHSAGMTNVSDLTGLPAGPRPTPEGAGSRLAARVSRAGALTGLAGVARYAAGVLLPGSAPGPDAATTQVAACRASAKPAR